MIECNLFIELQGFVAEVLGPDHGGVSGRGINRMTQAANRVTAEYWYQKFLPGHFNAAQKQYRLQPRKKPYAAIKKALAEGQQVRGIGRERVQRGGVIDIVRSGITERQARSSGITRATPTRAIVYIRVPHYAAMRRKDPTQPYLPDEITKVTASELNDMRLLWQETFIQQATASVARATLTP